MTMLASLPRRYARITSGKTYLPQIDGLRFLAILPVILWHSGLRGERMLGQADTQPLSRFLPHGEAGVMLFFFVSGFIIAFPFVEAAMNKARSPSLSKFYLRRLTRLEPPYILALLLCFAALAFTGYAPADAPQFNAAQGGSLTDSLLASLVYMHTLIFNGAPRLDPPLWSLEVEIQFYLLAPFFLAAFLGFRDPRRRTMIGLALVVLSVLFANTLHAVLGNESRTHWTLLNYFGYFLLGVIASDYAQRRKPADQPAQHGWDFALAAGIAGLTASGFVKVWPGFWEGVAVDLLRLVSIAAIYAGAMRGVWGRKLLGAPWIALIGGMCYSIYLTHVPLLQALSEVVVRIHRPESLWEAVAIALGVMAPATIVAGFVYYLLIERPCMDPKWPQKLFARLKMAPAVSN
jgi:peptidoglycan/LPS O-acetylase OafA/YrhL